MLTSELSDAIIQTFSERGWPATFKLCLYPAKASRISHMVLPRHFVVLKVLSIIFKMGENLSGTSFICIWKTGTWKSAWKDAHKFDRMYCWWKSGKLEPFSEPLPNQASVFYRCANFCIVLYIEKNFLVEEKFFIQFGAKLLETPRFLSLFAFSNFLVLISGSQKSHISIRGSSKWSQRQTFWTDFRTPMLLFGIICPIRLAFC